MGNSIEVVYGRKEGHKTCLYAQYLLIRKTTKGNCISEIWFYMNHQVGCHCHCLLYMYNPIIIILI